MSITIPATAHMLPVSFLGVGDEFVCDHTMSVDVAPRYVHYRITGEPFEQLGTTLAEVRMTTEMGGVTYGHIALDDTSSVLVTARA